MRPRRLVPAVLLLLALAACGDSPTDQGPPQPSAPSIQTTTLPVVQHGDPYSGALTATGGDGTYTWAVSGGALPTGLSLTVNGTISGTSVAEGDHGFTAQVSSAGLSATRELTLTVSAPPAMAVSPASMRFSAATGSGVTSGQPLVVGNSGGGTVEWSVSGSDAWILLAPSVGTVGTGAADTVLVSIDTDGLTPGPYVGRVVAADTMSTDTIEVSVTIAPAPVDEPLLVVHNRVLLSASATPGTTTDLSSTSGLQVTVAEWSPLGDEAAVIADGTGDLFVFSADGLGIDTIAELASPIVSWPSWAPDGGRIAFGTTGQIYVVDRDGQNLTNLTPNGHTGTNPHFSPDGQWIVYQGADSLGTGALFRIRPDGSDRTAIVPLSYDAARVARYSPNGDLIAFDDQNELWIVAPDGTGLTPLTNSPSEDDWHPRWSPDGTRIAFHIDGGTNWKIGILDVATGDVLFTTGHPSIDGLYPAWAPDGNRLAFRLGPDIVVANANANDDWVYSTDGIYVSWHPGG